MDERHPKQQRQLDQITSTEPDLDKFLRERVEDLRFGLKKDLDRYWVENHYEEFNPNFPKTFLLTEHELSQKTQELDEYSQSALQEFKD